MFGFIVLSRPFLPNPVLLSDTGSETDFPNLALQARPDLGSFPQSDPTPYPPVPMAHVLIIHEVADYPAWKKVFDGAAGIRKEAGERSFQVLRYESDANRIVHFSVWTSVDDARRFFESPRLVRIREEAGVKAPEFIYLEQLDSGTL
jgi:quinol monooxygenase YgiN